MNSLEAHKVSVADDPLKRRFLFSAKDNAFYLSDELHLYESAGSLPTDLKAVSESTFFKYALDVPPDGKMRAVDAMGMPCWGDQPPLAQEVLAQRNAAKREALMREAANRIAPLQDAVDLGINTVEESAALTAWKQYRVLLNRLVGQEGYPLAVDWPAPP